MFQKGQVVKCVDAKMGGIGDGLKEGKLYHIEEYLSPEECVSSMPNNIYEWETSGGRVTVKEEPLCHWYGRRFEAVE